MQDMKEEIVIKVKVHNPDDVLSFLNANATFVGKRKQRDTYFVKKDKDYFLEKPTKEFFRMRSEEKYSSDSNLLNKENNEVAYHFCYYDDEGNLTKTDEYEMRIEDPVIMKQILEHIDMVEKIEVEKLREVFKYKKCEIVFDTVSGLGKFVEIEVVMLDDSERNLRMYMKKILREIGIDNPKQISEGYALQLLRLKNHNK
jgi:predicted adenylyl cyclase CyaB